MRLLVTPGQAGDVAAAPAPLDGQEDGAVLANKVYDSKALRELIVAAMGAEAVTSSN